MKPWISWQQAAGECTMLVTAGLRAVVTGEALAAGLRTTSSAMLLVALTWKPSSAAPATAKASSCPSKLELCRAVEDYDIVGAHWVQTRGDLNQASDTGVEERSVLCRTEHFAPVWQQRAAAPRHGPEIRQGDPSDHCGGHQPRHV